MLNRFLKTLALIIRALNSPHFLKYLLFLFLKSRNIPVKSSIKISNAKMNLNLGDFIDYWIFMEGSYEEKWIKQVEKLIIGKVFIDIGANIGIYSLSLFKKAEYTYAFEPDRNNYKKLVRNIKINHINTIKTIKKAVFDKNGSTATLYKSEMDKGWSSLMVHYTDGSELVKLVTLDYFLIKNKIKNIGLIKIDVEGAELKILKGSQKTIHRLHPPILIEFNKVFSKVSENGMVDIYQLMTKSNYRAYRLKHDQLVKFKIPDISAIDNENILFVYRDQPFSL